MKAWILRRDLPRSSKFTIKMYADNGFSSSGFDSEAIFSSAKQCSLVRRAKSRMKDLSKMLTLEAISELERS